jgi:hypothetical protein
MTEPLMDFKKFNAKLHNMPDRQGSVAEYWMSLEKKELINFLAQQCYFIDHYMERGDDLERKVNDLSRDKRALHDLVIECVDSFADMSPVWAEKKEAKLRNI